MVGSSPPVAPPPDSSCPCPLCDIMATTQDNQGQLTPTAQPSIVKSKRLSKKGRAPKRPYKKVPSEKLAQNIELFTARCSESAKRFELTKAKMEKAQSKFVFHQNKCTAYKAEQSIRDSESALVVTESPDEAGSS